MILEMARLRIDPARSAAFEEAVADCVDLFRSAPGCLSMALERELEEPGRYVLRVGWNRLEDHMVGFRGSPAFAEWRARVGSFFVQPPDVVHHAEPLTIF